MLIILVSIAVGVAAFLAGFLIRGMMGEKKFVAAEAKAKAVMDEANKYAQTRRKELELEAKDFQYKLRNDFEKQTLDKRHDLQETEKRLMQRQENVERRVDVIDKKEREVTAREKNIVNKEAELQKVKEKLEAVVNEEKQVLQKISGLSVEEAKKLFLNKLEQDLVQEKATLIKRYDDEIEQQKEKKAKEVISLAIQKFAAEHTTETTVSVVNLPNDDMKGRIIGREGRNIRALEIATGIDIVVDDTPEAVIISGFDPVRREIARLALEKLISDGRIHPGRIEEVVEKAKTEVEVKIKTEGEQALYEIGVHNAHPEVVKLIGRLKYRTSYGQNCLQHSKETAYLMGVMAGELKLDFKLARRVGLLHDLGKAVSHEIEGTHTSIGADLARKYGEPAEVIEGIASHHQDIPQTSIYSVLVQAADAISASRPGVRRETLETYIKRLSKLESIADSFKGVDKAYAIQAGREVRVIVIPEKISDAEAIVLARDITKKIEEGLEYPGQIKVTVIRETRAIEYAK